MEAEIVPVLTVVIPVHNGARYIEKTVEGVLCQSIKALEIILVENFSADDSWHICKKLQARDTRVIALQSEKRGTNYARQKGILRAKGKYITFSDQDDRYIDTHALQHMVEAIAEDGTDACQFGNYREYFGIFTKKFQTTDKKEIYGRREMLSGPIKGIISSGNFGLTMNVWSKIYRTDIMKRATEVIPFSLFYCEDTLINNLFFFDKAVSSVSLRPECYYVWRIGVGASSGDNASEKLFQEYNLVKPIQDKLCSENNVIEDVVFCSHWETIGFLRYLVNEHIWKRTDSRIVLDKISKWMTYRSVVIAQDFLNTYEPAGKDPALRFLSSHRDAEEILSWCQANLPKRSPKQVAWPIARRIIRLMGGFCQ